jgi:hypothetical protein
MKGFNCAVIFPIVLIFFVSCVSTKEIKNTKDSPAGVQSSLNIIERLKTDLGKSVYTIISENPMAIRQNPNSLIFRDGDVFEHDKFYGYSWRIKDGFIEQVDYLQPFDQKSYQDSCKDYISVLGKGIDFNGNGFGWLIPEKDGITIILVNDANNSILHSSSMGYSDILVELRNK